MCYTQLLIYSIDLLQLPDEPPNAVIDVPDPIFARTKFEVSYPASIASAKSLNVVRCKEIVEQRINIEMICNKRFLKPTIVSI